MSRHAPRFLLLLGVVAGSFVFPSMYLLNRIPEFHILNAETRASIPD